jgi:hypothetical protein
VVRTDALESWTRGDSAATPPKTGMSARQRKPDGRMDMPGVSLSQRLRAEGQYAAAGLMRFQGARGVSAGEAGFIKKRCDSVYNKHESSVVLMRDADA